MESEVLDGKRRYSPLTQVQLLPKYSTLVKSQKVKNQASILHYYTRNLRIGRTADWALVWNKKNRGDSKIAPAHIMFSFAGYSISFSICSMEESRASTIWSISSLVTPSIGAMATFSIMALA